MTAMAKSDRRSGPGRPRKHTGDVDSQGRSGKALSIRLDPELRGLAPQFQAAFLRKNDVKLNITDVIELALRRLYREWGLLPPEDDQAKPASPA